MNRIPLKWDGTQIGPIDHAVKSKQTIGSETIVELVLDVGIVFCRFYKSKDAIPCMIDELKPLFGLPKIGRHRASLNKVSGILELVRYGAIAIYPLSKGVKMYKVGPYLDHASTIRKLIVFKWLMYQSSNYDSNIRVSVTTGYGTWFDSKREDKMVFDKDYNTRITDTAVKRWFNNDWRLVKRVLKEMLASTDLLSLRFSIPAIIRKVDSNLVGCGNAILTRIHERS